MKKRSQNRRSRRGGKRRGKKEGVIDLSDLPEDRPNKSKRKRK